MLYLFLEEKFTAGKFIKNEIINAIIKQLVIIYKELNFLKFTHIYKYLNPCLSIRGNFHM